MKSVLPYNSKKCPLLRQTTIGIFLVRQRYSKLYNRRQIISQATLTTVQKKLIGSLNNRKTAHMENIITRIRRRRSIILKQAMIHLMRPIRPCV